MTMTGVGVTTNGGGRRKTRVFSSCIITFTFGIVIVHLLSSTSLVDPNNVPKTKRSEDDSVGKDVESCLRPRTRSSSNNDVLMVKSVLLPPFINLGMPKMGTSSLNSYFTCGGYETVQYRCGSQLNQDRRYCGDCIADAVEAGLPPLSKCNMGAAAYTQIDRGPKNLVQVNYLNEIVGGVPNATFILTFRNMTNWYRSMSNWGTKNGNMRKRFERASITGLPTGVGRNVSEFSHFYCEYVKRVRAEVAKYPGRHKLVEIDIEDPNVGWQLEEAFGTSHTCWGKKNAGYRNNSISQEELQRR